MLTPVGPLVRRGIVGGTSCWGEEDWRTQELLVTFVSLYPVRILTVGKKSTTPPVRVGRMGGEARDKRGDPWVWVPGSPWAKGWPVGRKCPGGPRGKLRA